MRVQLISGRDYAKSVEGDLFDELSEKGHNVIMGALQDLTTMICIISMSVDEFGEIVDILDGHNR